MCLYINVETYEFTLTHVILNNAAEDTHGLQSLHTGSVVCLCFFLRKWAYKDMIIAREAFGGKHAGSPLNNF